MLRVYSLASIRHGTWASPMSRCVDTGLCRIPDNPLTGLETEFRRCLFEGRSDPE
jgi:hypothetical protein